MKGRPAASMRRDLSHNLLQAAVAGLREKSHLDLTSREIAAKAGTHAGMVNYYFEGKDGLLLELLTKISNQAHRGFLDIEKESEFCADPTEDIVRVLVNAYYPHRDVLSVILIEVFRQGSAIREHYSEHVRERHWHIFPRLEAIVRGLIDRGVYRRDLDSVTAAWTFLSLVAGPLILVPVSQANGGPREPPSNEAWIAHVVGMIRAQFLHQTP